MNKLISIIVPNFNKESFIRETLDSILNQNYQNWEAIIIDDGSTDSSISIINEFIDRDKRFILKLRGNELKGASSCRNIGVDNAKGDYIIFLDSDDLLLNNCLQDRMNAFKKFSDMDFIVFPMGTFYNDLGDNPMIWSMSTKSVLDKFLSHSLPWTIVSPIWKRSTVEKLQGFDPRYERLQDVEFHTRALLNDDIKFKVSDEKLPDSFYRIGKDRKNILPEQFYSSWVTSSILYIDSMTQFLKEGKKHKKIYLLKGTLIKTITSLLYAYKVNLIDESFLINLLNNLTNKAKLEGWKSSLLTLYIYLYKVGFYKIKGFNFIFQKTFIYLG